MRWINIKKSELTSIECINPYKDKYILRLSPNSKNIVLSEMEENNNCDTRILSTIVNNIPTLDEIKKILLSLQKEYDNSREINHFIINNKKVWLDSLTRGKILNYLNNIDSSTTTTTLWFDNYSIELPINKAIQIIIQVGKYSKLCFDNTQKHYVEINQLNSIEDCLQYDITVGYPAILNIQI